MIYTHKGWFGFCPVYLAEPQSSCPDVVERHWSLKYVLDLNVALQQAAIAVCTLMAPDWEPTWKIRVTKKLDQTIEV